SQCLPPYRPIVRRPCPCRRAEGNPRRGPWPSRDGLRSASRAPSTRAWAHLDSNQGPGGYEPPALTAELWAQPCTEMPCTKRSEIYTADPRLSSAGPTET